MAGPKGRETQSYHRSRFIARGKSLTRWAFIQKYKLMPDAVRQAFRCSHSYLGAARNLGMAHGYQAKRALEVFAFPTDYYTRKQNRVKRYPGEYKVLEWLLRQRFKAKMRAYNSPYDLVTGKGVRIEVKTAAFRKLAGGQWGWQVNIHRHGKVSEREVDVYMMRLENCPFSKGPIHLVIPSPLTKKTLAITPRSMMTKWGQYYNAMHHIKKKPRIGPGKQTEMVNVVKQKKSA